MTKSGPRKTLLPQQATAANGAQLPAIAPLISPMLFCIMSI
jgi:hypothetical protein